MATKEELAMAGAMATQIAPIQIVVFIMSSSHRELVEERHVSKRKREQEEC